MELCLGEGINCFPFKHADTALEEGKTHSEGENAHDLILPRLQTIALRRGGFHTLCLVNAQLALCALPPSSSGHQMSNSRFGQRHRQLVLEALPERAPTW